MYDIRFRNCKYKRVDFQERKEIIDLVNREGHVLKSTKKKTHETLGKSPPYVKPPLVPRLTCFLRLAPLNSP